MSAADAPELRAPSALGAEEIARWRAFQAADTVLQSPFFCPEFAQAIEAARVDVATAVLREGGEIVAFLPHHRVGRVGKPVGGPISDYQGLVHAPGFDWPAERILAAAGLDAYDFNHAPATQTALSRAAIAQSSSSMIDLSQGYDAWLGALCKDGRHAVKETERRMRKAEREIGPLRFTLDDPSEAAFAALETMKDEGLARIGAAPAFGAGWVRRALARIRAADAPEFAGLLSTLHAGDRLLSCHLGMRSASTWCWWFNAYDRDFAHLAPGLMMILEAARAAPGLGVARIDFGRGEQRYKRVFANAQTPLTEGSIARPGTRAGAIRSAGAAALALLARLPLGAHESLPRRAFARAAGAGVLLPEPSTGKTGP